MTIDPRLIERRKAVAEDHATRTVGRLLRVLMLAAVLGLAAWTAFSPWLSVSQVRIAGVATSDANTVLANRGVVAGTPMVLLRPGSVEQALIADPWVRDARVHLNWPDEVTIRVIEREPVAWYQTAGGWARRDIDGVAVPGPSAPDETLPWVRLPGLDNIDAEDSPMVLGAAEFAASLPISLQAGASLHVEEGELWATVGGYQVRLGRPIEMEAKALSLVALLNEPIPAESVIVLVAPTHPAIRSGVSPVDTSDAGADEDGGDDGSEPAGDQESDQP